MKEGAKSAYNCLTPCRKIQMPVEERQHVILEPPRDPIGMIALIYLEIMADAVAIQHVMQRLQVDLSINIRLTERISVFGEALNITNETVSTHGRFSNQFLDVYAYGRRFTAGARYRF